MRSEGLGWGAAAGLDNGGSARSADDGCDEAAFGLIPPPSPHREGFVAQSRRRKCVFVPESLEGRVALSGLNPVNTVGVESGAVAAAGNVAGAAVNVGASHFTTGRAATVLTVTVAPLSGSTLEPRIVGVVGANGKPLVMRRLIQASAHYPQSRALAYDYASGPITVLVAGAGHSTGAFNVLVTLPGDVNGSGAVTLSDGSSFSPAYNTHFGNPYYNNAADANLNGYVGIGDGKLLLRNTPLPGPIKPLKLVIGLAPKDQVKQVQGSNSGGQTYHSVVTVVGKTTPGSIVFLDDPNVNNFTFTGLAIPTDAKGNFSYTEKVSQGVTANNMLVIDPYGQKLEHVFPILRL